MFIFSSDVHAVEMNQLAVLYHDFADSLLRTTLPPTEKLAGPVDWVLFLKTLYSDGNFDPGAAVLHSACSKWQFIFRSIRLHTGRLQLDNQTYSHPPSFLIAADPSSTDFAHGASTLLLGQIDDPEDELYEANKLALEVMLESEEEDDDTDGGFEEDSDDEDRDAVGEQIDNLQAHLHQQAVQLDEPELLVTAEPIDFQDIQNSNDILKCVTSG